MAAATPSESGARLQPPRAAQEETQMQETQMQEMRMQERPGRHSNTADTTNEGLGKSESNLHEHS